LHKNINNLKL